MKAFHDSLEIKQRYLDRVTAHAKADELIKGKYWEGGKGCAVGCTIHSGDHANYETELGIPRILARLEDGIFEALPNDLAMTWPQRFLEAITPGADLSKIWHKFAIWLLVDPSNGVLRFAKTERTKESINKVANLYLRDLRENSVSRDEWRAAADAAAADADAAAAAADADAAAAAAAADAADAAAYAAYAADAADAADAAADDAAAYAAADDAAAYAAYAAYAADAAAAAAAAAADARRKARIIQSEKLLELLREAK